MKKSITWGVALISCVGGFGCGKVQLPALPANGCAPTNLPKTHQSTGKASVFIIDPISASGNLNLFPTSQSLDHYTSAVTLDHLTGQGILSGTFVDVINPLQCDNNHGAFQPNQDFRYSHKDDRFQEAMAYYTGDQYRAYLNRLGYVATGASSAPVIIGAHCNNADNAYFTRMTSSDGKLIQFVCLGDSVSTPGAFYGDDGIVTVHELQHATTSEFYSPIENLNQFYYDEAGALNEAVSDFMGLMYADLNSNPAFSLDQRIFSRWALGTFNPYSSHIRGAHRCPMYDVSFPECGQFPQFSSNSTEGHSQVTISYTYPDGIGWPFPNNYAVKDPLKLLLKDSSAQEEIHNAGVPLLSTLWEIYSVLLANHSNDKNLAQKLATQLVIESIKHLPMPDPSTNHSPVTWIHFASNLVTVLSQLQGLTPAELTSKDSTDIQQVLQTRGLIGFTPIDSSWLGIGPGANGTTGMYIVDDPYQLRGWLRQIGADPKLVTQNLSTGINSRLDPGEIAAIWFDLKNNSPLTVGGVLVTVTSLDPDVTLLDQSVNVGYLTNASTNSTQIMLSKINGTEIVKTMRLDTMKNTYFTTNQAFSRNFRTAIWVKVSDQAAHGKTIAFQVRANAANGDGTTAQQIFKVTLH